MIPGMFDPPKRNEGGSVAVLILIIVFALGFLLGAWLC